MGVDLDSIADRTAIRKSVQSGNVQDAIERVNDLNPEVRANAFPGFCYLPTSRSEREVRMWVGVADSGGARAALLPPAAAAAHRAHPRGQYRAGAGVCAGVPSAPWRGERTAPAVPVAAIRSGLPSHRSRRPNRPAFRRFEEGNANACCCARTTSPARVGDTRVLGGAVVLCRDLCVYERAVRWQAAFLEELERTMALLAFEDTSTSPVGCEPLSPIHYHPPSVCVSVCVERRCCFSRA